MIVNFISAKDPFLFAGGGDMINRQIVCAGQKRGHQFRFTTGQARRSEYDEGANLDLVADAFANPWDIENRLDKGLIGRLGERHPFVHVDNAYVDLCNMSYLPCNGHTQTLCPWKIRRNPLAMIRHRSFTLRCTAHQSLARNMYAKAALCVFDSPLHARIVRKIMGPLNSFVLGPLVEADLFFNRNAHRDIDYLFVGYLNEAKGFWNMKAFAQEHGVTILCAGRLDPRLQRQADSASFRLLGHVPREDLPQLYNRAKKFLYLPRWPEPQGRVVVEAMRCGCEIVHNENVGALSFQLQRNAMGRSEEELDRLWETIESVS